MESQYVTNGQPVTVASSAAASAASSAAAGPKKKERKRAHEKKNHAVAQQPVVDEAQALEQLKVCSVTPTIVKTKTSI